MDFEIESLLIIIISLVVIGIGGVAVIMGAYENYEDERASISSKLRTMRRLKYRVRRLK